MAKAQSMASLGYVDDVQRSDDDDGPPATDGMPGIKRFYGKYRGTVLPMPDVERRGRLYVQVGDANGPNITNWARPCLPWAGLSMGSFVVPAPGAKVWVEFEQGHPDYPIWVGCWWGSSADAPLIAKTSVPLAPIFALESLRKQAFVISDAPLPPYLPVGGILIGGATACIAIDESGVRIFGPTVQVNGEPSGLVAAAAALLVTR
jgi:hypothetical protein